MGDGYLQVICIPNLHPHLTTKSLVTACISLLHIAVFAQLYYMRKAVAYLNSEPAVERYAWFTTRWYSVSWRFTAVCLLSHRCWYVRAEALYQGVVASQTWSCC